MLWQRISQEIYIDCYTRGSIECCFDTPEDSLSETCFPLSNNPMIVFNLKSLILQGNIFRFEYTGARSDYPIQARLFLQLLRGLLRKMFIIISSVSYLKEYMKGQSYLERKPHIFI